MAQNSYKSNTFKKGEKKKTKDGSGFSLSFFKDPKLKLALGFFLLISSLYLVTAFISYLFAGKADQSVVEALGETGILDSGQEVENWLGLYGAITSHYFIFRWFGISAFFIPPILFILGFRMVFKRTLLPLFSLFIFSLFSGLWLCLLLGYITNSISGVNEINFLSGGLGYELAKVADGLLGWGTFLVLVFSLFVFIIYFFNVTAINAFQVRDPKPMGNAALVDDIKPSYLDDQDNWKAQSEEESEPESKQENEVLEEEDETPEESPEIVLSTEEKMTEKKDPKTEPSFVVEEAKETDIIADKLVAEHGVYDPTMDLSKYKFPPLELLDEYDSGKVQVTQEELTQNKDRILETLTNFKIGISSIKATIGPTVTLYEIVPEAGIKISRIKNLEDDIALSLSALGIRIIAPIP
ncbi:MAG TPA: DNA translocase FtsK 4TM domain-containing protein, partial [Cyclobacteriaceae bacterium]